MNPNKIQSKSKLNKLSKENEQLKAENTRLQAGLKKLIKCGCADGHCADIARDILLNRNGY